MIIINYIWEIKQIISRSEPSNRVTTMAQNHLNNGQMSFISSVTLGMLLYFSGPIFSSVNTRLLCIIVLCKYIILASSKNSKFLDQCLTQQVFSKCDHIHFVYIRIYIHIKYTSKTSPPPSRGWFYSPVKITGSP